VDCKFVAQEPTYARVHVGGVGLSHKRVVGAIAPTGCGGFGRRSIGDNRSTKMVEPLSPMAPHGAQAFLVELFTKGEVAERRTHGV